MKKIYCKIHKIQKCGNSTVYDVTVDEIHRLLANNFYTSNCNVDHPDIEEFIEKKQDLTKVTGANVSVQVTDDFMEAVENDETYLLRWPVDAYIHEALTEKANGVSIWEQEYGKLYKMVYGNSVFDSRARVGYMKKVRARDIWNKIIHCAWNTAEPGIIFKDRMLKFSPDGTYDKYKGVSTNPCVTGDTIINTMINDVKGYYSVVELLDMFNDPNRDYDILVKSYNIDTNKVEYKKLDNIWLSRKEAEVIDIEVNDGKLFCNLTLTPDHKVYVKNDNAYVEVQETTSEDILLISDPSGMDEVSDGFITNNSQVIHDYVMSHEDVYDLTVEDNHNFFANGILVKNCGEIFMSGNESCRLMAINMTCFVDEPYTKNAKLNISKIYNVTYEAMRLADDLVDLENEAVQRIINIVKNDKLAVDVWKGILDKGINGRRTGLELTGMSDMIAMLNVKYCTDECNQLLEKVCRLMMSACLDCQSDMAMERGQFPDEDLTCDQGNEWYDFIKTEFPHRAEKLFKTGRRNISYTCCGPCGSLAILCRTSSGVEPVFMPYYVRRRKCTNDNDRVDYIDKLGIKFSEFVVVHPGLKNWALKNIKDQDIINQINDSTLSQDDWKHIYEQSPWLGACAQDIDWQRRVELQGIVQKYFVTHSISSTVNLPNSVTEQEVSDIYVNSWKNGLKGITVYRDGSREGIMVQREKKKEDDKFESYVQAPKRPKSLEADFYVSRVKGETFYVMVGLYNEKPYEIFVYKVSEDEQQNKYPQHKGTITKMRKNVYKYTSEYLTIDNISMKLSTEELAMVLFSSMLMRTGANLKYIIKTANKVDDNIASFTAAMTRILKKYVHDPEEEVIQGEVCPDCGGRLIRENGCIHCIDCGWSRCG